MTDNATRNQLPPPVRRIYRATTGKRWLGVARGVADYTGAPLSIVRLAFVLLTFAGGLGLFAYLAAAVLIPKVGEVNTLGDRVSGGRPDRLLAIIAAVAVGAWAFFNGGSFDVFAVAALGGAGYYLWTKDRTPQPAVAGTWPNPPAAPVMQSAATQDVPEWQTWKPDVNLHDDFGLVPPPVPLTPLMPPVPVVPRRRGWGWASLAASIGTMVVFSPFASVYSVILAGFVVLLAGFIIGLIARRPSWALVVPLLALAVVLPPAKWYSHAGVPLNERSGQITLSAGEVNADPAAKRLSAGQIKVDLRGVTITQPLRYTIGAGQIEVLVPENVGYILHSDVSVGDIKIGGQDTGGASISVNRTDKPEGALRTIELDLKVGIGNITITRTGPETGAR